VFVHRRSAEQESRGAAALGVLTRDVGGSRLLSGGRRTVSGVRIETLDLLAHADQVDSLKRAALATVAEATGIDSGDDEEQHYERHAARDGFRAVGAWDGDRLVGFAYGYRETPGSWWEGWVRPALDQVGEAGLLEGAFEVVALHVLPELHGQGVGTRLLAALLDDVDAARVLLTTQDGANPARVFYRARGFREVATLPYGHVPYLVLARDLP
jgi:GNAT superfamily N-acetyltransferase